MWTVYPYRLAFSVLASYVLATVACGSGVAAAHEDSAFHLAGARFCVDPASVQVVLELPPERRAPSRSLKSELGALLEASLERSGVAYEVAQRCTGARDYTSLSADVRYLDPETYIGFGEEAYTYTLFLQVGAYTDRYPGARTAPLPPPAERYTASLSEIYAEGDGGGPFEPFVAAQGAELVQELTRYWREDNPRRLRPSPPLLGVTLALLSSVSVGWALRRRRAGRTPRGSS